MSNEKYMPASGRLIDEDGQIYNVVDLLGGDTPTDNKVYNIEAYAPTSGRVIGEDGKVYNLIVLLRKIAVKSDNEINLSSLNVDEEGNPYHQINISDKSGIRILSKSSEDDKKKYIRIGELSEDSDDIAFGIQYENEDGEVDFYVGAAPDSSGQSSGHYLIRLSEEEGPINVIRGNGNLKILSGANGQYGIISFDTEDAGIKYTRGTWTEILKQLDVSTTKGINMEAQNNSYWWVNAAKKAQYGNSLNKLEFRTDGVAKFSNIVNASDLQIGGTPVLDKAKETAEELANIAMLDYICNTYDENSSNKDYVLNYLLGGELEISEQIQIGENVHLLIGSKSIVVIGSGATYDFEHSFSDEINLANIKNILVLNGVTYLGQYLFCNSDGALELGIIKKLIIPLSVESIGTRCFQDSNFEKVIIGNKQIKDNAFNGTSVGELICKTEVTLVDDNAFEGVSANKFEIEVNGTVGDGAFWAMKADKAEIDIQGTMGSNCFNNVVISEGVININTTSDIGKFGYGTFDEINIETTGTIGNNALGAHNSNQNIKANSLSITASSMGQYAVEYAEIGELTLNVPEVGWYAFQYAQIEEINLCEGLETILSGAFIQNTALKEIVIPSTVTSIAFNAFDGCTSLKTITVNKPTGSITGAPWGATKASIVWTG